MGFPAERMRKAIAISIFFLIKSNFYEICLLFSMHFYLYNFLVEFVFIITHIFNWLIVFPSFFPTHSSFFFTISCFL